MEASERRYQRPRTWSRVSGSGGAYRLNPAIPTSAHGSKTVSDFVLIPLNGKHAKGRVAIVDSADAPLVQAHAWHCSEAGYAVGSLPRQNRRQINIRMHRFLFGLMPGDAEQTLIDHINRDKLDNRRANLRIATKAENCRNSGKVAGAGHPVFKGVREAHPRKSGGVLYTARIVVHKKTYSLGVFDTDVEAALAYDTACRDHFGEFACVNFPDSNVRVEARPNRSFSAVTKALIAAEQRLIDRGEEVRLKRLADEAGVYQSAARNYLRGVRNV